MTAQSDYINTEVLLLIDLNDSNMIISSEKDNKFIIRNRKDLSIIKIIEHDFGYLYSGLCYPDQKVVVLGIGCNIIKFDY